MIQLGLSRIGRLVDPKAFRWKALHVAGTNGKGSVCAFAAAMLAAQGLRVGRFTSPHLIDRWDCIEIDGRAIEERSFTSIEQQVLRLNHERGAAASEFELLTAVAFEAFNSERVDVGVVEVGMGGRIDATNILQPSNVLASVITKISMDHQAFLGNTLSEIAEQKAGIIKPGVPCFYDASNHDEVTSAIRQNRDRMSEASEADLLMPVDGKALSDWVGGEGKFLKLWGRGHPADHQMTAIALAVAAVRSMTGALARSGQFHGHQASVDQLLATVKNLQWPGRLQLVNLDPLVDRSKAVLLDGAHNMDAARVLAEFVSKHLRRSSSGPESPVTWVYASSEGKDVEGVLQQILRPGDSVFTTTFGPVDGMPWVRAESPEALLAEAQGAVNIDGSSRAISGVRQALHEAAKHAGDGPLVVTGSLYLVSDVLRALRSRKGSI